MTIQNVSYVYIYLKYIKCSVSEVLKRIYCQTNSVYKCFDSLN